jgi:hypothetical protein
LRKALRLWPDNAEAKGRLAQEILKTSPREYPHKALTAAFLAREPVPTIQQQPQPQTVAEGENVVFRTVAQSEAPLAYQWQFDGTDIPGATNATCRLQSVTRQNAGVYTIQVRNALAHSRLTLTSDSAPLVVNAAGLSFGAVRREVYRNIRGGSLPDLTNSTRFPNTPDTVDLVHQFETPPYFADNYGVRLTGYLVPPKTGPYRFYLSSDDEGALFLSTDDSPEHKREIAHEPAWNRMRRWIVAHSRRHVSEPVHLEAGRHYYMEALMKDGVDYEYLGVAWQMPGDLPLENFSAPIPGGFLAVPDEWLKAVPSALTSSAK